MEEGVTDGAGDRVVAKSTSFAEDEAGLLILRAREAGGPTGTMREPNSTPIVTS